MSLKSDFKKRLPEGYGYTEKAKDWFGNRENIPNDYIMDAYIRWLMDNSVTESAVTGIPTIDELIQEGPVQEFTKTEMKNIGSHLIRPHKPVMTETEIDSAGAYMIRPHKPEQDRPDAVFEGEIQTIEDPPVTEMGKEVPTETRMGAMEWTPESEYGPNGEDLPEDAIGWDKFGNPYFGREWKGYTNRFNHRWGTWSRQREEALELANDAKYPRLARTFVFSAFSMSSVPNVITSAFDLLIPSAEYLERGISTTQILAESLAEENERREEIVKERVGAAEEMEEEFSGAFGETTGQWFTRKAYGMTPFWLDNEDMPEGVEALSFLKNFSFGYQLLNFANAVKPGITLLKTEEGRQEFSEMWADARSASRAGYTAHANRSVMEGILQKSELSQVSGEQAVGYLANPWSEMMGQMIADPVDWVLGKPGRALAKFVGLMPDANRIRKSFQAVDRGQALTTALSRAENIEEADNAIRAFVKAQMQYGDEVTMSLEKARKRFGWRIRKGLRAELYDTIGGLFKIAGDSAKNPENAAKTLLAMAQLYSKDADEVEKATRVLLNSPAYNTLMSEKAQEGGLLLWNLLKNEEGFIVADDVAKLMHSIADSANPAEKMQGLVFKAIKDAYPDLKDFVKLEEAGLSHEIAHKLTTPVRATEWVRKKVLTPVYLGLNWANLTLDTISSFFLSVADESLAVLGDMGNFSRVQDRVTDTLGFLPEYLQTGQLMGIGRKTEGKINLLKPLEASFEIQRRWAVRLADKKINAMLRTLNKEGAILPDASELISAGFDERVVNLIRSALMNNNYKMDEVKDVLKMFKGGIDHQLFRNASWVPAEDVALLQGMGFWDEFVDALKVDNVDDMITGLEDLSRKILGQANYGKLDSPTLEKLTDLTGATKRLVERLRVDKFDKAEDAMLAGRVLRVDDVKRKAKMLVSIVLDEAAKIVDDVAELQKYLEGKTSYNYWNTTIGEDTYERKSRIQARTWELSDEWLEAEKGFEGLWKAQFPGVEPPFGASTRGELRDSLWSYYGANMDDLFRNLRDSYYQQAKQLMVDVIAFVGDAEMKKSAHYLDQLEDAWTKAMTHSNSLFYDKLQYNLGTIVRGAIMSGDKDTAIRALAARFGLGTMSGRRRVNPGRVIAAVNEFTGAEYTRIADIPLDEALDTFRSLYQRMGLNVGELADLRIKNIIGLDPSDYESFDDLRKALKTADPDDILEFISHNGTTADFEKIREALNTGDMQTAKAVLRAVLSDVRGRNPADVVRATEEVTNNQLRSMLEQALRMPSDGSMPSFHYLLGEQESRRSIQGLFERLIEGGAKSFAEPSATRVSDEMIGAMKSYLHKLSGNLTEAKAVAGEWARKGVNFVFPNYNQKYGVDMALSLLYTYPFWYTRTAAQWLLKSFTTNPRLISNYLRLKRTMIQARSEIPERYRTSIDLRILPGMDAKEPIWFQADRWLSSISFLTDERYEDPYVRSTWYGRALDEMRAFGPTINVWWNVLASIGMRQEAKRERDFKLQMGAERIAGRLVPLTGPIKDITAMLGLGKEGRGIELDPFRADWGWGDGIDPYQRDDIARELFSMYEGGEITLEEYEDIARDQSGEMWELAIARASQAAAPTGLIGYFTGAGIRPWTQEQEVMQEFYNDLSYVFNSLEGATEEQQLAMWDKLDKKYPWKNAYLLSRKGGPEKDRAYAYSVLSRVPPGQTDDIANMVGLPYELLEKFWDTGGNVGDWTEEERNTFMGAIATMGAVIAIPDDATKEEWAEAKKTYKKMVGVLEDKYGENIMDRIGVFMALKSMDDPVSQRKADQRLKRHPDIGEALDLKTKLILSTPILSIYYSSQERLYQYLRGQMWDTLEQEFGEDIWDKWEVFYDYKGLCDEGNEKYCLLKDDFEDNNPDLDLYRRAKSELEEQVEEQVANFVDYIPEAKEIQTRPTEGETVGQEELLEGLQAQQTILPSYDFAQWHEILGDEAMADALYAARGGKLSEDELSEIEKWAESFGVPTEYLILAVGNSR